MTYDLVIIGGGPAGTAAAVYAARKHLKTLLLTSEWGGQSIVSELIYNWIGTPSISGADLAKSFKAHIAANTGEFLEALEPEKVNAILKNGDLPAQAGIFTVKTESGKEFETKTILIATGSNRRQLEAKGALEFEHKGLTYCASCDGPLYGGADVIVVGGGNAGFESAAQLLAYCKSVTLLSRGEFRADEITVNKVLSHPNMTAVKNTHIVEVTGDKFVNGLIYKNKDTGEEIKLDATGIFVEVGQIPNTSYAKDVVTLDELGRVKIDFATQKTETPGIWAAGDCTNVLYHQNNIAAGDAVRALEDIYLAIHTK